MFNKPPTWKTLLPVPLRGKMRLMEAFTADADKFPPKQKNWLLITVEQLPAQMVVKEKALPLKLIHIDWALFLHLSLDLTSLTIASSRPTRLLRHIPTTREQSAHTASEACLTGLSGASGIAREVESDFRWWPGTPPIGPLLHCLHLILWAFGNLVTGEMLSLHHLTLRLLHMVSLRHLRLRLLPHHSASEDHLVILITETHPIHLDLFVIVRQTCSTFPLHLETPNSEWLKNGNHWKQFHVRARYWAFLRATGTAGMRTAALIFHA